MADENKIVEFVLENYKKVRVVAIKPDGKPLILLTGKNAQGKSSVLEGLWFALKGQKALPAKKASIIRDGAERMKIKLDLGDCIVTRSLGRDGNPPTLSIEMVKGTRDKTPQDFLDGLFTSLTFDPLQFLRMEPKEQVNYLQKIAAVDLDFAAIAEENEKDYNERAAINRSIGLLEGQAAELAGVQKDLPRPQLLKLLKEKLAGFPKLKVNEAGIVKKLEQAAEANRKAQGIFAAKQELGVKAANLILDLNRKDEAIAGQGRKIELLEAELARAKEELKTLKGERKTLEQEKTAAEKAFQLAPAGEPIDVTALTVEMRNAQQTNRVIDVREQWEKLQTQADDLTRRMEAREEKKRAALAKAKIPVDGLSFDELEVKYNGRALENMSEGEQIRISTQIAMAGNPKLRVLCIRNGESLDEDGLKIIAELAELNDFQVWMSRMDTSGKIGIVLEDGMIVARNEERGK